MARAGRDSVNDVCVCVSVCFVVVVVMVVVVVVVPYSIHGRAHEGYNMALDSM